VCSAAVAAACEAAKVCQCISERAAAKAQPTILLSQVYLLHLLSMWLQLVQLLRPATSLAACAAARAQSAIAPSHVRLLHALPLCCSLCSCQDAYGLIPAQASPVSMLKLKQAAACF
jgi:hypothetical protein